jgi:Uma2 family endonuclease
MPHGLERNLSYSDLLATPNDGKRYELIRGNLFVNPSPTTIHQRITRKLARRLEDYFHARSLGEVFGLPVDVILTPHDVFVPDIIVVAEAAHISKRGVERPPLLAVEVLSPSTRRADRGLKRDRYAELGIHHYWIVDPYRHRLECFHLEGDVYRVRIEVEGDTTLAHPDFDDLAIDLAAVWNQSSAS